MARILDRVIVVDVEATCWETGSSKSQKNEIIEIGVCLLDLGTGRREDIEPRPFYVKPTKSRVSSYCAELTGITQEMVDQRGIPFARACEIIRAAGEPKHRTWASYGDYDRRMFERQCERDGVAYPFGVTHINVKNLFAVLHGLKHEVGMDKALQLSGLALEGRHHSGRDDAWNIAKILWSLCEKFRLDI